jgi:uncharacterized protein (TIGR02466 family)
MDIKLFNPTPIAKVQVDRDTINKIDQLSVSLFSKSSITEDYPETNTTLTLRGGEQRRVLPEEWLVNWIETQAREFQLKSEVWPTNLIPKLANCWTIAQPEHSYQVTHTHPHGSISGNLYLEIPEFKDNSPATDGCISFQLNPPSVDMTKFIHIKPTVGCMLIFPSWLPHQVYPWQGAGMRRVLAWDCQLLPQ